MPKKISRRRSKHQRRSDLWIFVIIGLLSAALVWLIIRKPETSDTSKEAPPEEVSAESTESEQSRLDNSIRTALDKLGIPDRGFTRREREGVVFYNVSIDRTVMDLTFANMIIKSEAERGGATLSAGTDKAGRQTLNFTQAGKAYQVNLVYDSKPYAHKTTPKYISIVVDDFGSIGGELLQGFLNLPAEVTFAIFPDMPNSIHTMQQAQTQGRETLIHVPMEPIGYPRVDPGKNPILVQMGEAEVEKLLTRFIHQMPDCIGINNHMGSFATTDPDVMARVMKVLKSHGKMFLDSRTSNVSVAYQTAQRFHIPAFRNDIFLDSPNVSAATFEQKLAQIKTMSATNSNIIAITHCHNQEKLDYLNRFIARLRQEGFILIPLSRSGKYDVPPIS